MASSRDQRPSRAEMRAAVRAERSESGPARAERIPPAERTERPERAERIERVERPERAQGVSEAKQIRADYTAKADLLKADTKGLVKQHEASALQHSDCAGVRQGSSPAEPSSSAGAGAARPVLRLDRLLERHRRARYEHRHSHRDY